MAAQGKKINIISIILTVVSGLVALICLALALSILQKSHLIHRLGNSTLPKKPDIGPHKTEIMVTFKDWANLLNTTEEAEFYPPRAPVIPQTLKVNLHHYPKPAEQCNRRDAHFLYRGKCFYFTRERHSFENCFGACKGYSEGYYFYTPDQSNVAVVRRNLKGSTVWVGAFKRDIDSYWINIEIKPVPVIDIYGSYCAYMSSSDIIPRSYANCAFPRHCLCAGETEHL